MSSFIEILTKQVECPVCMETYKEPKALPCLHTYCKGCLQQLVARRTQDQSVSCPQCRAQVRVEGNDVDNLPTVFFINELIETLSIHKKADNNDVACQNCSKEKAVSFCQTCPPNGMFVCVDCVNAHNKIKLFASHKVIPLSALRQGSMLHLPARNIPQFCCKTHEGELKKLYCYQCKVLICRDCTLVDHHGHQFNFVKSVATAFKEEVQTSLGPLQETLPSIRKAVERVIAAKVDITNHGENSAQHVNTCCDHLVAVIEEQRRVLLEQNKMTVDKKLGKLESQHERLERTQATIDSLLSFVEKLTSSACDEEFVSMKASISNRIDDVIKGTKDIEQVPAALPDFSVTVCPSTQELEDLCKQSCLIQATIQDVTEVSTNSVGKFSFHLNTQQSPLTAANTDIKVCMKSLVNRQVSACSVCQITPSTYQVSYTPQIRGRHQLSVSVNNCVVATKLIFVHHPPTHLDKPVKVLSALEPWGITISGVSSEDDDLYIIGDFQILKYNGRRKCGPVPLSEGGEAAFATTRPRCVDVGSHGCIFASTDYKLFKFNNNGELVKTVGTGKAGTDPGEFDIARGVCVYQGEVYVCDWKNCRVQVFDTDLHYVALFGNDGDFKLRSPIDIDFDSQGDIYITDIYENHIAVFNSNRTFKHAFGAKGNGRLLAPWGVCVFGEHVYVTEHHGHCVSVFLLCGQFVCSFGHEGRLLGQLMYPHGISVDSDGFCFVSDEDNNRIQVF